VRSWCASAGRVAPTLRERAAPYRATRETPYAGSTRYYRGRIVDRLRLLGPGESLAPAVLGEAIKPGFGDADRAWLDGLLRGLARDGLVVTKAEGTVALP
jgi:hypothetical protein